MIKILLILIFSASVNAENWLIAGSWSQHPEDGMKNKNNMIGFETDIDGDQYFLLKFDNSFGNTSYYGGKIVRDGIGCYDDLCLGYNYGIMKGYEFKEWTPIGFINGSYEQRGIGVDVSWLPGVVANLRLRFNQSAFDDVGINAPWDTIGYFEIGMDKADPDGRRAWGYNKENGVSYNLKFYTTDDWYLKFNYTDTVFNAWPDTDDDKLKFRDELSRVNSQGSIELWKEFESYSFGVSYNQISLQHTYRTPTGLIKVPEKHYKGFGMHISVDYSLTDKLNARLEFGIVDQFIWDVEITGELSYQLFDQYELILRWIDYERWNRSQGQLAIRYSF